MEFPLAAGALCALLAAAGIVLPELLDQGTAGHRGAFGNPRLPP